MASGFGGRYQGSVVDDADPIGEHRLRVIVPEVWGTEAGAWAVPSLPPGGAATPAVGDLVWVTFEGGDTDYPVRQMAMSAGTERSSPTTSTRWRSTG